MKKIIALTLTVLLCLGAFAGCQSSTLQSYTTDAEKEQAAAEAAANLDYTACYETYPDDKVMLTVDGIDTTWGELFYWMVYDVQSMAAYGSPITDWDAECVFDTTKTNRQFVQEGALDTIKQYKAIEAKAKAAGVELTAEDEATLAANWQTSVDNYGGGDEAAFIEYLQQSYVSKATYDKISRANALTTRLLEETYGANGEKLPEQDVLDEAEAMGYMRVKHIYFAATDAEGAPLTEEGKAGVLAQAESVRSGIAANTSAEAIETAFDAAMANYSEDPGKETYPNGYTFKYGDFGNEAFESAAQALGEYELSPVIEAAGGYHIILRLPLDAGETVFSLYGGGATLNAAVAQSLYQKSIAAWAEEAVVDLTRDYERMDIAKIFSKAVQKPVESETPEEPAEN